MTARLVLLLFRCTLMFFGLAIVGAQAASPEDDISVEVRITPSTIGMDEQAVLEVTVSGSGQNLPDLSMPSLPRFEVYSQGRSSSVSIVNGAVSSTITQRFLLLPHEPGTFRIDSIAVVQNGHRYAGNSVQLTVVKSGQSTSPQLEQRATDAARGGTRDYFLEASVDKKSPYVNEQVTLTLRFYIAVQYYSSPELEEPSTTGFWTEVLGNSSPYFKRINGRNYRVIERKYALFPTQSGDLTIGRASITTTVANRSQKRDPYDLFGDIFPQGEKVTTSSSPLVLSIKPLPTANQPDDFTGSIGRYRISTRIDRTEVEVNQPVTVSLNIEGEGNIKTIAEPLIEETQDFRVYRASSKESMAKNNDIIGGTKTFEEVFLPKRPGILEIPAITLSYFDPERGRYETLTTKPFTVSVKKPEGYAAAPDIPYARPGLTLGTESQDIRYIKNEIGDVRPAGQLILFSPLYVIANSLPLAVLVGMIAVRKRREHLAANVQAARSRGASRMARRRLAKARSLARMDTVREFYSELSLAQISYIADKLNISPHGLTSDQIGDLLKARGGDDGLVAEALQLLHKCDYARFAPANLTESDLQNDLRAAETLMDKIEGVRFA